MKMNKIVLVLFTFLLLGIIATALDVTITIPSNAEKYVTNDGKATAEEQSNKVTSILSDYADNQNKLDIEKNKKENIAVCMKINKDHAKEFKTDLIGLKTKYNIE